ncbi:dihydropteroate synthase [Ferroacidibacillus organovorans]|uniref:Dihydropteroate synthase n=2 Tax=Ferroacidibacillus organovorans TaxID=1765683 RepID=A0A162UQX5_9BACL|nr:dihydropteroate synthase [Ferroacidibacillus organovorans]OAG94992.1 dihydropteroate synthase [Ferroacidibacillus organovorans]OPG15053.1 dihydropteroate synthase [Ferroacidibacillus organovorans]
MRPRERRSILTSLGQRTLVMGILNVTPDSFSDGGHYIDPARAIEHALDMVALGADLIDLGAESTRPGHAPLSADEEWRRIETILEPLREAIDVPISIDTYKGEVASKALAAGIDLVNDVWGGKRDEGTLLAAAAYDAPLILMHNSTDEPELRGDVVEIVCEALQTLVDQAIQAGVSRDKIILDPGIGFGKTMQQNLRLINETNAIKRLGYPVLVGTSRKSVIGHVLNLPVQERVEGTAATVALAIARGADIVRVHDVGAMARVVRMTDAMVRA